MLKARKAKQHKGPVDPPDGGWGWVVVGAAFVGSALTYGPFKVYPVFFLPLMEDFHIGLGDVTWLTGSYLVGKAIGGLFLPFLVAKLGYRGTGLSLSMVNGTSICLASVSNSPAAVFVLAGFVPGLCMGVFVTLFSVAVSRYFSKRRILALAIFCAGEAVGTLALSPLLQYLIDVYGWRGGMLLLGGIAFNIAVAASLIRPIRLKTDEDVSEQSVFQTCKTQVTWAKQLLRLPKVYLLCVLWTTVYGGWHAYFKFIIPYAHEVVHVDGIRSASLLSIHSVVNMLSNLAFGAVGDRKGVNVVWLLIGSLVPMGIISACIWFVDTYVGLLINTISHALMCGGILTLYIPVVISVVGESRLAWGYTLVGFGHNILVAPCVPLIGMLVDATGEMRVAFVVSGCLALISAILHLPLIYPSRSDTNENHGNVLKSVQMTSSV